MKKREGNSWIPAAVYSKQLTGLTVNLLVREIAPATAFARDVLAATVVYEDPDFAAIQGFGSQWCLHADHTYSNHPLSGSLAQDLVRGLGAEIRLMGCDPDIAEAQAREFGYTVLAGAMDKPHGMRESYLLDADGYCWVPSVAL
jgi:hypothetical protein